MNGKRIGALTAAMDMMPALMDMHGVHHKAVLFGYFGKDINMFDGQL